MKLHDHLDEALDRLQPAAPDLGRLAVTARRQGRARRRRRNAGLATAAVLTCVTLAVALGVGRSRDEADQTPVTASSGAPAPSSSAPSAAPLVPTTARGVVAALADAVAQQRHGRATDLAGQGGEQPGDDSFYSELHWYDDDGAGLSVVGVNVQVHTDYVFHCTPSDPQQVDCREATQPDGDKLTTYTQTTPTPHGTGVLRVADLLRPDGVRVVVSSSNGVELADNDWDVTRPQPPLTTDQLVSIAELGVWGGKMPQAMVAAGAALQQFHELATSID